MTEAEFLSVSWPDLFVVEYSDGSTELLSRGDGLLFSSAEDDPTGRAGFWASLPPRKHRHGRHGRGVHFDELRSIRTEEGRILWSAP